MLDIVHRLYENYDESYCKEKYLKSKSELLEMINSAMSDTDLKEELLCDTYSFNNCISVYRKVWEKKYSEKEIITKPILFTAMPCEVAESHMITVF